LLKLKTAKLTRHDPRKPQRLIATLATEGDPDIGDGMCQNHQSG